ncbi:hypothetical protein JSE7799_00809 [Jannaschia seosinensis]|uniref:Uncharacterized protein n=1 Tax=Jannaschia seosinensis TaxID=313367 RepID=A0A0M7B8G1_9RHOB|nr:hypothetical protein [Jannaschia seosinensis]CUH28435.1 hypothetical protein JSE7799_00809 [Jannaschia seosinensis]
MLHVTDLSHAADTAVIAANEASRQILRRQGDDCVSARRVDFGFRRRRLFAARPDQLRSDLEELGFVVLPGGARTRAEGDLILTIQASPYAADFDRLDSAAARMAARAGWTSTGWSAAVREAV